MGIHRTAYIDPSPGLGFGLPAASIPGSANESYEIPRAELSAPWLLNLLLTCLPLAPATYPRLLRADVATPLAVLQLARHLGGVISPVRYLRPFCSLEKVGKGLMKRTNNIPPAPHSRSQILRRLYSASRASTSSARA